MSENSLKNTKQKFKIKYITIFFGIICYYNTIAFEQLHLNKIVSLLYFQMADGYTRHHESGTVKRRKREKKEEEIKKMHGAMDAFLKPKEKDPVEEDPVASVSAEVHAEDNEIELVPPDHPDVSEEIIVKELAMVFDIDPAKWHVSPDLIDYFSMNNPPQNVIHNHHASEREYGDKKRYVRKQYFARKMNNGETVNRGWLVYSLSTGNVYCYICTLFCAAPICTDTLNIFVKGFSDWKNADVRISSHEKSNDHKRNICKLVDKQKNLRIDSELVKQEEKELGYWIKVLNRIIAVIQFLTERGLAFRGDSELFGYSNNGNYMGCLELIAKFDDFLSEHIRQYGNPGRGQVSYLSSTICDEFIHIIAEEVKNIIVEEVKLAKYYGLSIDSTPDIAHTDQMTLILRYALQDGSVVERFVCFIVIENHGAQHLFDSVMKVLTDMDIDINNCKSQSYDNASNMAGVYSGVQARIKEINPFADFVPCSAHSLNLVGSVSAECSREAISFFGVLQGVYNFLSASPQRWAQFIDNMNRKVYVIKSLAETRWSARADATKALALNYSEVIKTLIAIANNPATKPEAVNTASALVKSLKSLETALMCTIWNEILKKMNIVSKALQEVGIEICMVVTLMNSLVNNLENMRDSFEDYEQQAKMLVSSEYKESTTRKRQRKTFFDETTGNEATLTPRESFRTQTFLVIVDSLVTEMKKRSAVYRTLGDRFDFLTDYGMPDDKFREKSEDLIAHYKGELENDFTEEMLLLRQMVKSESKKTVSEILQYVTNNNLGEAFPNACIAFRIYLSIFGTSCEGERSFSTLRRIKNYTRSTMGQQKLTDLSLLCIESDLMRKLKLDDIIHSFASKKCRKAAV